MVAAVRTSGLKLAGSNPAVQTCGNGCGKLMSKKVTNKETYKPPKSSKKKEIIVYETDDNVRYIFVRYPGDDKLRFSHRLYPERPKTEQYVDSHYPLPQAITEAAYNDYGGYVFADSMIPEAQLNIRAVAKFQ